MLRLILLLTTLSLIGCSSVETRDESYTVLTHMGMLSKADIGGLPPQDVVAYGDTLYVLSRDNNNVTSLSLLDKKTLATLDSWMTWTDSAGVTDSLEQGQ